MMTSRDPFTQLATVLIATGTLDPIQRGPEAAALQGIYRKRIDAVGPEGRRGYAQAIAEVICRVVKQTCANYHQINALLALLYELTPLDTTTDRFFTNLAERTEHAVMLEYAWQQPHALCRLFEGQNTPGRAKPLVYPNVHCSDPRLVALRDDIYQRFVETVRREPASDGVSICAIAKLDELARHTAWSELLSSITSAVAPDALHGHHPPVVDPRSDAVIRRGLQAQAHVALDTITNTQPKEAATIAAIYMLAARNQFVRPLSHHELHRLYREAWAENQRVVVRRIGYLDQLWYGEETGKQRHAAIAEAFDSRFHRSTLEVAAECRAQPQQLAIEWSNPTDDDAMLVLKRANPYQEYVVELLTLGRWNTAEQWFRGTFWTGAYDAGSTPNMSPRTAAVFSTYFEPKARQCLLKLAVVAMYNAFKEGRYGTAAALGQVILDDCDLATDLHDSAAGELCCAYVANRDGCPIDKDNLPFRGAVQRELEKIKCMTIQAIISMLGTEQVMWLEHL